MPTYSFSTPATLHCQLRTQPLHNVPSRKKENIHIGKQRQQLPKFIPVISTCRPTPVTDAGSTAQGYGIPAIVTSNRALLRFSYRVTLTFSLLGQCMPNDCYRVYVVLTAQAVFLLQRRHTDKQNVWMSYPCQRGNIVCAFIFTVR